MQEGPWNGGQKINQNGQDASEFHSAPRLYASQNPFAQVSYLGPRSSRKEDGMLFLRRQLLRTLSFAFGSSFILGRNQLAIAAQTAVQPKTSPLPAGAAVRDAIAGGTEMEKVTGIGGFFFRAKDPKALAPPPHPHPPPPLPPPPPPPPASHPPT